MYTSSELERLFLLWKSAEVGWETDDGQPVRERALSVETSDFVYLVKGGRWLLVATQAGAVKYYDLDAEVITGVALIPDQTFIAATAHSATLMSVDVDQDSPVLSFRLAFALCGFGPSASFQIWQINPMLDDSQRAIGLTATLLASLAQPPDIVIVLAISLLRNQLAFNGILLANNEMFAFVMDWRQGNGTTSTYNRRMITTSMIILVSALTVYNSDELNISNTTCRMTSISCMGTRFSRHTHPSSQFLTGRLPKKQSPCPTLVMSLLQLPFNVQYSAMVVFPPTLGPGDTLM